MGKISQSTTGFTFTCLQVHRTKLKNNVELTDPFRLHLEPEEVCKDHYVSLLL